MKVRPNNYWNWRDSELKALAEEYRIALDEPFNRKTCINMLKEYDAVKAEKGYVEDGDGNITLLEQEKIDKPRLEMRRVIFHSTGEQDLPYLFIGHNGRGFYIPKEVEIDVPVYLLNSCIKDAVEDRLMPQVDPSGRINWIVRKVQRHPYSLVQL